MGIFTFVQDIALVLLIAVPSSGVAATYLDAMAFVASVIGGTVGCQLAGERYTLPIHALVLVGARCPLVAVSVVSAACLAVGNALSLVTAEIGGAVFVGLAIKGDAFSKDTLLSWRAFCPLIAVCGGLQLTKVG